MTNNWYSKQVNMRETLGPWVSDLDIEQYMALQENWQPGDKRIPKMPGSGGPDDYDLPEVTPMELACEALVQGNHSLALERFEELLRSEPNNTMVLNNYATSLLHMETDLPRAETMLQRALALDPGYSDARNNLALLFARTGRDDEAEAALRASLAADPADIPAMVNLAVFLRDRRHNYTGAYALLERADEARTFGGTSPGDIYTLANLITLLVDHMPRERFVQDDQEVCGPHYNLTGLGLARRLMFRCLHIDAAHGWVQEYAPILLSKNHPSYAEYRAGIGQFRPSDFEMIDGKLVCCPSEPSPAPWTAVGSERMAGTSAEKLPAKSDLLAATSSLVAGDPGEFGSETTMM